MAPCSLFSFGVELQPEPVGQPGQVIENSDYVTNFQACRVVESQFPERLPVALYHPGGRGAQLFGDGAQGSFSVG